MKIYTSRAVIISHETVKGRFNAVIIPVKKPRKH